MSSVFRKKSRKRIRKACPIGVTSDSMTNHAKRWTRTDDAYLRRNYTKKGTAYCAKHRGRTVDSIRRRVFQLGLRRKADYPKHIHMHLVKTPTFAYVLGFLWADGCMVKGRNGMRLQIKHEDGRAIKPFVDYTGTWTQHDRQPGRGSLQLSFDVWDARFASLLRELDYVDKGRVPFKRVCEYLGSDLMPFFIHGFFDGDGSIASSDNGRNTVTFAGAVDYDWSYLAKILTDAGIKKVSTYKMKNASGAGSALYFSRQEDVVRFYRIFIHHPGLGLPRKIDRFRLFIEKMVTKVAKKRAFTPTRNGLKVVASVKRNGRTMFLGHYDTNETAQKAVDEWEKVHRAEWRAERAELIVDLDAIASV